MDPAPRVAAVIPAHLNVRAGPSTGQPAFAVLQAGHQVHVVGKTGTWSAIDMNGKLGFVLTSLITP